MRTREVPITDYSRSVLLSKREIKLLFLIIIIFILFSKLDSQNIRHKENLKYCRKTSFIIIIVVVKCLLL